MLKLVFTTYVLIGIIGTLLFLSSKEFKIIYKVNKQNHYFSYLIGVVITSIIMFFISPIVIIYVIIKRKWYFIDTN